MPQDTDAELLEKAILSRARVPPPRKMRARDARRRASWCWQDPQPPETQDGEVHKQAAWSGSGGLGRLRARRPISLVSVLADIDRTHSSVSEHRPGVDGHQVWEIDLYHSDASALRHFKPFLLLFVQANQATQVVHGPKEEWRKILSSRAVSRHPLWTSQIAATSTDI